MLCGRRVVSTVAGMGTRTVLAGGVVFWVLAAASGVVAQQRLEPAASSGIEKNGEARESRQETRSGIVPEWKGERTEAGSAALGASGDYIIGPEDVLQIDVFQVPELSKEVRVANDGMIAVALLGKVKAAGLTPQGLSSELEAKWGETYLEDPQVSVFVKDFHARPVSVIGAVDKPGQYYLTGPRTLVAVLSMAGGLAKRYNDAPGRTLLVTRKAGFEDTQLVDGMRLLASDKLEIDVRKLLYSKEEVLDIPIKPFDMISVTRADVVYVVGEVRKPGGFVLQDQDKITVLQALALAEGLSGTAAKKAARIIRKTEDGTKTEIAVNLGKVLKGKSPDPDLIANDILFVPDSAGKAAGRRAVDAAVSTVSGIVVWRGVR